MPLRGRVLAVGTRSLGLMMPSMACASCFGQSDSPLAKWMNWGIFTLLLVVFALWAAVGSFFVFIARRSARVPLPGEPDPIHAPDGR